MAAIDMTRPLNGFGFSLARLFGTVASWNDARATRKALSSLSRRELDDIGLCPGDIDRIAEKRR
ncbi:DUF1127 domain-containing protein [Salibaculum sp.]|uniref:DUF1127 domain-containing protein n=1 Tax=Salibaculum sp. TaxID=2855480 RepID=UPI002B4A1805|nr:DUF1127 domain-containing protein [Salibaculum sp.]HKL69879.1 DUF1127 domain-containing protein [Salibaculum sp.]